VGASLEFSAFSVAAAAMVAVYIVVRFLGKSAALLAFGAPSGIRPGGAGLLAIALVPLSGSAVVMVRDTTTLYPEFGKELAAVVLSVVGAFYYLRVVKLMYFDDPVDTAPITGSFGARVLMSANGLAVLAFGIFPGSLMALCYVAIATL